VKLLGLHSANAILLVLTSAALLPATMAAGDSRLGGAVLLAGFRELRDFFPPLAAANLAAQGMLARGVYLRLPPIGRRDRSRCHARPDRRRAPPSTCRRRH